MSPLFIFFQFTSKIESKIENFNLGGLRLMITACTRQLEFPLAKVTVLNRPAPPVILDKLFIEVPVR